MKSHPEISLSILFVPRRGFGTHLRNLVKASKPQGIESTERRDVQQLV
jgi:hypothetical protein